MTLLLLTASVSKVIIFTLVKLKIFIIFSCICLSDDFPSKTSSTYCLESDVEIQRVESSF